MARFKQADWPVPVPTHPLQGSLVSLEPLTALHADELGRAGADPLVWRFTTSEASTPEGMRRYVNELLGEWEQGTAAPFAVRRTSDGLMTGCTRLKQLNRRNRNAVMGSWYAPEAWRTGVNLEAKLLLLNYAFGELECVRIEFHTDTRNDRSRSSLLRLGATFEGILRAHQITRDGMLRDTAVYSVLQNEWPGIRERIRTRLRS